MPGTLGIGSRVIRVVLAQPLSIEAVEFEQRAGQVSELFPGRESVEFRVAELPDGAWRIRVIPHARMV